MPDRQRTARIVAEPTTITLAACGDLTAQRQLADYVMQQASEGAMHFWDAVIMAMAFTNLAIAHGNIGDKGRMLSLLAVAGEVAADAGDLVRVRSYEAQYLALLREAVPQAEREGYPLAGELRESLEAITAAASPENLADAAAFEAERSPSAVHSLN